MSDADRDQYHARAVADCDLLLAALAEVWVRANAVLSDRDRGTNAVELRNVLVGLRAVASDTTRRVMRPVKQKGGE